MGDFEDKLSDLPPVTSEQDPDAETPEGDARFYAEEIFDGGHRSAGIPIRDPKILSDLFQNSRLDEEGNMVPKEPPVPDGARAFQQGLGEEIPGRDVCYACGAPLPGEWAGCPECGHEQTYDKASDFKRYDQREP